MGNGALTGAAPLSLARCLFLASQAPCLWFGTPQGRKKEEGRGDERILAAPGLMCGAGARPPRRWANPPPLGGRHLPRGIINNRIIEADSWRIPGAVPVAGCVCAGWAPGCGHGDAARAGVPGHRDRARAGVAGLGDPAGARGPCRSVPSGSQAGLAPLPAQPQPFPAAMAGPRRLLATARPQGGRHGGTPPGRAGPCVPLTPLAIPVPSRHTPIPTFPFPPPQILCPFKASGSAFKRMLREKRRWRGKCLPTAPKMNKTPQKVHAGGCQEGERCVKSLGGVCGKHPKWDKASRSVNFLWESKTPNVLVSLWVSLPLGALEVQTELREEPQVSAERVRSLCRIQ